MIEKLHEECGVFGIYDTTGGDVAASTYFALYALQHRGQESCGIAVNDCGVISSYKDVGLVPDVFTRDHLEKVGSGQIAVGHVRYSTIGIPTREDSQPLVIRHVKGPMVVAHNGNLVNAEELKEELELKGAIFHTNSDAEIIAHVVTEGRLATDSIEKGIELAMDRLKGAYSMVMMSATKLIAVRDPEGFRPLCIGEKEGAIIFASETCALDSLGAKYLREVDPGEIVVVDKAGMRSIRTHCKGKGHVCVFEYVYFARPDSVVEGASVHEARQRAGAFLALESPVQADVVIGVPDSGLDAALGFSKQSGIPYGVGFIKNRYVGRTFIQPTQAMRENAVRIKLNALSATVKGKRVVLVDDSIVRGTTSARIVKLLREAGATEVHMRISSPPFMHPCFFGTDVASRDKLIACRLNSVEEIAKEIGVDSLAYMKVEDMKKIAQVTTGCDFCVGCFTGEYPIETPYEKPVCKYDLKI
ncbi:amidophosphoribosyltransferase [Merdimmobilis hominis]|uniref:Amidophosphoribosyltransferase n=1 Tax=uncultured Anaerotruncus sp. TaxID=905011 RepID=A0A6N2SNK4_9FIRM|nr:amidophosphoribosyltransferase [Merdimmobilis hominis]MCD4836160.1 amidophosphoribosyltransferase [Merdimmobilis hominis]PWL63282.1 MAG: amidophosphoribosyltransferase [Oscillospiraceae bacterium]